MLFHLVCSALFARVTDIIIMEKRLLENLVGYFS